jgi:hypothetical protein
MPATRGVFCVCRAHRCGRSLDSFYLDDAVRDDADIEEAVSIRIELEIAGREPPL